MVRRVRLTLIVWLFSIVTAIAPKRAGDQLLAHLRGSTSGSRILSTSSAIATGEPPNCYSKMPNDVLSSSGANKTDSNNRYSPSNRDSTEQNSLDNLWTWTVNGSKIDGTLSFLTGAVELIQRILAYWRDQVLTWWSKLQQRVSRWSSGTEFSIEDEEDSDEGEYEDTTDDDISEQRAVLR